MAGPAGDALLADARREAEQILAQARSDAAQVLTRARQQADALIASARAQGQAEGQIEAAQEVAREHALARMEVLAARRQLYDELRRRARSDSLSLREEPGYRALLDRLAAAARRDLGDRAELELDPDAVGGVRARAGSLQVDYTLPALAERCIDALGPGLQRLWR